MTADSNGIGLLFRLLTAHVLSDFVVQPSSWVTARRQGIWKSRYLYLHGLIAALAAYLFVWRWSALWLIPVVFCSHVLIDGVKSMARDTGRAFALDQAAHLVVLLACWLGLSASSARLSSSAVAAVLSDPRVWLVALGYFCLFWPSGILIGKATAPWRLQLKKEVHSEGSSDGLGLESAGLWIGRLERVLILTFVLIGRFDAIGFLIAAKSILRFGEAGSPGRRKETEYILIGTLLSFTLAVAVGLACRYGIQAMVSD